jgi:hypothetical protein
MNCLPQPCGECPFTKTSMKGWLGDVYEDATDLHRVVMSEFPFPCHQAQTDDVVTIDKSGNEDNPLCAGALLYMRKNGKLPRNPQLKSAMDSISSSKMDNILSVPEFIQHHKEVLNGNL